MLRPIRSSQPPFHLSAILRLAAGLAAAAVLLLSGREVLAVELNVLAAGATESTLRSMIATFEKESGNTLKVFYSPVGALRDKIYAGEPADVTLVTPVIIEQLQAKGLVRPDSRVDLGKVGGGIAVRKGAPTPPVATPEELKQALLAASEVYYANPETATAGAYFLKVADELGIGQAVRQKGRIGKSGGKEAMQLLGKSTGNTIGLTQVSEILSVPEVELIGPYPGKFQTFTTYSGIILVRTQHLEAAQAFLRFLMSPPVQARFHQAGYEAVR